MHWILALRSFHIPAIGGLPPHGLRQHGTADLEDRPVNEFCQRRDHMPIVSGVTSASLTGRPLWCRAVRGKGHPAFDEGRLRDDCHLHAGTEQSLIHNTRRLLACFTQSTRPRGMSTTTCSRLTPANSSRESLIELPASKCISEWGLSDCSIHGYRKRLPGLWPHLYEILTPGPCFLITHCCESE